MKNKMITKFMALSLCASLAAAPMIASYASNNTSTDSGSSAAVGEAPSDGNGSNNGPGNGTPPDGNGSAPEAPPEGNGGNGPGNGTPPDGAPGNAPGGSSTSVSYNATKTISESTSESGKTYKATESDTSALMVTGGTVTEDNLTVEKTGDASSGSGDNSNFYGLNAAVLAKDGTTLTIRNAKITSSASGANGVFSYGGNGGQNGAAGDGTTVNISDSTITTTGSGSGGIMTTGGGTTNATNLTVETSGQSSAAIRTDRGGGTVTVNKGTYKTNGLGSPAVYSTADITVSNATLESTQSEVVVIEGKNTVTLNNTSLTANNTKTNGNATHYDGIFMYQSMSGDADSGTSKFTMTGGSITNKNGEVFHVASTDAVISLKNVSITNQDKADTLLDVSNDGWSSNGNNATLNATSQTLTGNIIVSSAASQKASAESTLKLALKDSSFKGAINTSTAEADRGTVDVTLDSGSVWQLTADSYVSSISGEGKINYNGHTLYVDGKAYTAESPYSSLASTTETVNTDTNTNTDTSDTTKATKKVTFKNTSVTVKAATLKKAARSYSIIKKSDGGKVTVKKYGKNAKKYLSVSSAGKVTVKKNTPKGTYKVTVKVAAKGSYKAATKTITVKVK